MTEQQRVSYYAAVCESVGLNPLTKPFEYLTLPGRDGEPGKVILYANKNCAEQLRANNDVSVKILSRELVEGLFVVTASAGTPGGRTDESIGAVAIEKEGGAWESARSGKRFFKGNGKFEPVRGEARANAMMKAETKAKRRVTLSICGLGMPDESELEDIIARSVVEPPLLPPPGPSPGPTSSPAALPPPKASPPKLGWITVAQIKEIKAELDRVGTPPAKLLEYLKIAKSNEIKSEDVAGVMELAKVPADQWDWGDGKAADGWDQAGAPPIGAAPAPKLATTQQVEQLEREFVRTGWIGTDKLVNLLADHKVAGPAELTEDKAAWLIGEFANVATATARKVDDDDIPF